MYKTFDTYSQLSLNLDALFSLIICGRAKNEVKIFKV